MKSADAYMIATIYFFANGHWFAGIVCLILTVLDVAVGEE